MKVAVTVSLVPEAKGGPFIFWGDLPGVFEKMQRLGVHGIEIFPPGPEGLNISEIKHLCKRTNLAVPALGTGAGWVKHRLRLTDPDSAIRAQAVSFVKSIASVAQELSAAVIIGSMQGRWEGSASRTQALEWLTSAMANVAESHPAVTLLLEPLNRYESNLLNTLDDAVQVINQAGRPNVKVLADLYHMNIEETSLAGSILQAGRHIGHVHFADSNRRAIGFGHTDIAAVFQALRQIGYTGYLSAEVHPLPDSEAAAEQTLKAFMQGNNS